MAEQQLWLQGFAVGAASAALLLLGLDAAVLVVVARVWGGDRRAVGVREIKPPRRPWWERYDLTMVRITFPRPRSRWWRALYVKLGMMKD